MNEGIPIQSPTDYRHLTARMGYGALRQRLKKQAALWSHDTHQGLCFLPGEFFDRSVGVGLQALGLVQRGLQNCFDILIEKNAVTVEGLPQEFEGFRILHLSDLHGDLHPPLMERVIERVRECRGSYDLAVFTGDYSNIIGGESGVALEWLRRIFETIETPIFAVLGNHDFIENVAYIESVGGRVLLNEAVPIERNGARLWLAGIDDMHFFGSGDLVRAHSPIPEGSVSILLSHTAAPYAQAQRLGFSLMLCGHTHGGQICLPSGKPIINSAHAPRRMIAGTWHHKTLQGYTSRGTGSCGVAARFYCPPEITLHSLISRQGL